MRRATITVAALFLATLLWAGLLALRSPWEAGSGALLGVALVILSAVGVVGVLVAAARWARWLLLGVTAAAALLGITVEIDAIWILAVVLSGYGIAEAAGSGVRYVVRGRPSASGPPREAAAIPLVVLGYAAALAGVQPDGVEWTDWLAAVAVAGTGFVYAKAAPGSVALVRLVFPLFVPLSFWLVGGIEGLLPAAVAAALTGLAWTKNARVAASPLVESGRTVPIPPELAPGEILDAAGIDDRGRRTS
jgi:hypothetical protein